MSATVFTVAAFTATVWCLIPPAFRLACRTGPWATSRALLAVAVRDVPFASDVALCLATPLALKPVALCYYGGCERLSARMLEDPAFRRRVLHAAAMTADDNLGLGGLGTPDSVSHLYGHLSLHFTALGNALDGERDPEPISRMSFLRVFRDRRPTREDLKTVAPGTALMLEGGTDEFIVQECLLLALLDPENTVRYSRAKMYDVRRRIKQLWRAGRGRWLFDKDGVRLVVGTPAMLDRQAHADLVTAAKQYQILGRHGQAQGFTVELIAQSYLRRLRAGGGEFTVVRPSLAKLVADQLDGGRF